MVPGSINSRDSGSLDVLIKNENIEEMYKNEIKKVTGNRSLHPKQHMWERGGFEPFQFSLYFNSCIKYNGNTDQMLSDMRTIRNLAISQTKTGGPAIVTVSIGNFFYWTGVFDEVKSSFDLSNMLDGEGVIEPTGSWKPANFKPRIGTLDIVMTLTKSASGDVVTEINPKPDYKIRFL